MKTNLNRHQLTAYAAYDTSLMPISDPPRRRDFKPGFCGDHLYSFIMYELDDVTDDAEAIRRITKARLELQEIERALFRGTKP